MKKLFFSILLFVPLVFIFCSGNKNYTSHFKNFDFEEVDSSGRPSLWKFGFTDVESLAYMSSVDSTIKHSGKFSLKQQLVAKSPEVGIASMVLPAHFDGKKITVAGYVKTLEVNNGYAGLFLKLNGQNGLMGRDYSEKSGLRGSNDWKKFSITLPYSKEVEVITLGTIITGAGTAWFDDLTLTIDDTDITDLKETAYTEEEIKYQKSSHFDVKIDSIQVKGLAALGQLWSFLKYYHPQIGTGKYDWDIELLKELPVIANLKDAKTWQSELSKWYSKFDVPKIEVNSPPRLKANIQLNASYGDLLTPGFLLPELQEKLSILINQDNVSKYNYYVQRQKLGIPKFTHEKLYAQMKVPDQGYRILSLFRYWGFVQYFFPYRDIIGRSWTEVLEEYIPRFIKADFEMDYSEVCLRLITEINDSHAQLLNSNKGNEDFLGSYYPGLKCIFLGNKLFIEEFKDASTKNSSKLEVGDEIISVDDISLNDVVNYQSQFTPGSNQSSKLRDIAYTVLRGHTSTVKIVVKRNDLLLTFEIPRYKDYESFKFSRARPFQSTKSHWIVGSSGKCFYLNAITMTNDDLNELGKYQDLAAVIVDLRGNANLNLAFKAVEAIKPKTSKFALYTSSDYNKPGQFLFADDAGIKGGWLHTAVPKVVLLVDENTQSSGEHVTMAFQSIPGALTIGGNSAGADGDLCIFNLPGFVTTGFSSLGVFYPDKTPTQRKGVKIDRIVIPSLQSLKSGKDDLLDSALSITIR